MFYTTQLINSLQLRCHASLHALPVSPAPINVQAASRMIQSSHTQFLRMCLHPYRQGSRSFQKMTLHRLCRRGFPGNKPWKLFACVVGTWIWHWDHSYSEHYKLNSLNLMHFSFLDYSSLFNKEISVINFLHSFGLVWRSAL